MTTPREKPEIAKKDMKFAILGNQNAITYKEVFPYIKENIIWLGASIHSGGVDFQMPDNLPTYSKNVFLKDGISSTSQASDGLQMLISISVMNGLTA